MLTCSSGLNMKTCCSSCTGQQKLVGILLRGEVADLARSGDVDKAVDVNIYKRGHQELTVKPVHDSSMSRDQVTKILDLECTLKTRSKETSKRSNDGGKERHEEAVDEEGIEGNYFFYSQDPPPSSDCIRETIFLGSEKC